MARPTRCRRICAEPAYDSFIPEGISTGERTGLTLDEYEAIRLIDLQKCTHEQCARQMDISRTTVTELYESARYKIADSIVNGKALEISGGNYRFCDGTADFCCNTDCGRSEETGCESIIRMKGEFTMRIAVTYENGQIFQHFGHSESFKIYETEGNNIVRAEVIGTDGAGHSALAAVLKDKGVDVLICGGIGNGAVTALSEAGIDVYSGADGEADAAVEAYLNGDLTSAGVNCDHHHDHEDGHA